LLPPRPGNSGRGGGVGRQLAELVDRTDADELMITTMTHGPAARLRSYRLVAEAAGPTPAPRDPLLGGRAVG
jgi:hypothetical protein